MQEVLLLLSLLLLLLFGQCYQPASQTEKNPKKAGQCAANTTRGEKAHRYG